MEIELKIGSMLPGYKFFLLFTMFSYVVVLVHDDDDEKFRENFFHAYLMPFNKAVKCGFALFFCFRLL